MGKGGDLSLRKVDYSSRLARRFARRGTQYNVVAVGDLKLAAERLSAQLAAESVAR